MTLLLEEDPADTICADDWADCIACSKERIRLELADKIAEFQQNRGEIVEIPPGFMTGKTEFSSLMISNKSGNFSPEEVKAYAKRKAEGINRRTRSGDAEAVKILGELLDTAQNTKALSAALECSDNRVQRLIAEYFATDSRADRFRHRDRDMQKHEREMELVKKIRECVARGMVGTWAICREVHARFDSVTQVSRKYRIEIPRGKGGFRVKVKAEA